MKQMHTLTVMFFVSATSSVFAQNTFLLSDTPVNNAVNVVWDFNDLSLSVRTLGDVGGLTTTTLASAGGYFDPQVALDSGIEFAPFPDQNTATKFFKLTAPPAPVDGYHFNAGYYSFPEFDSAGVLADFTWSGSLDPSGSWSDASGGGPYLVWIPEPTSWMLLAIALPMLGRMRRR